MTFTSHWKIISTNLNKHSLLDSNAGISLAVLFIADRMCFYMFVIDKTLAAIYNHIKYIVYICLSDILQYA